MKTIEAAKDAEGAQPAVDFIDDLVQSRRQKKRDLAAAVAIRFQHLATYGQLRTPLEMNDLEQGIREIKAEVVRLPFYDALATGHEHLIRLTHGFIKGTRECPLKEIRRAIAIRREDQRQ